MLDSRRTILCSLLTLLLATACGEEPPARIQLPEMTGQTLILGTRIGPTTATPSLIVSVHETRGIELEIPATWDQIHSLELWVQDHSLEALSMQPGVVTPAEMGRPLPSPTWAYAGTVDREEHQVTWALLSEVSGDLGEFSFTFF